MTDDEMRDALYQAVYEDFVGPLDSSSDEKLEWVNPVRAYVAGVLHPRQLAVSDSEEYVADDIEGIKRVDLSKEGDLGDATISDESAVEAVGTSLIDDEEPIALSNAEHQSAMSLTLAVNNDDKLCVTVRAARYLRKNEASSNGFCYVRKPILQRFENLLPSASSPVVVKVDETYLSVMIVYRYAIRGGAVVTVALKNDYVTKGRHRDSSQCYFQCGFTVESTAGFLPLPNAGFDFETADSEELSNALIYSEIKNYAIGHGCASDWSNERPRPYYIETKTIPVAEVNPMTFSIPELKGNSFDMNLLGDTCRWEEARNSLFAICDQYEYWIDGIRSKAALFSEEWKCSAADNNVAACKRCLDRMRRGLAILQEDSQVREAFQLANKAMLLQYVHYSVVSKECDHLRQVNDGLRSWRPFQIAFLLMNIESMSDPFCDDRKLVDLIWFATGGGKTEAYLGLAAFTLILERLRKEECTGSSVIMRYTLRLLSSQQFDRAAALICALEVMRRDDPERFGNKRFTIGFWVGQAASPNTWKEALAFYDAVKNSRSKHRIQDSGSTAIPVTKCPWCGEPMGEDGVGLVQIRNRDKGRNGDKYLAFVCPNGTCDFGSKENSLPLEVVDDEIYFNPPSLLLGTVDKFATIPFRKGSYAIFGIDEQGNRIHSPKLIIQDELHLISGPLGSMMAHYETLVDGLCSSESNSGVLKPKIIASTATICRAREQCHQLFACGKEKVEQFPPSGISHLDSFFARSDMESPGRRYVGVYAPVISAASAGIRLYTSLLWEPNTWRVDRVNEEDRYWSVVGYYGSTRELGQALTWTASEIPERLYEKRRLNPDKPHRYLNNVVELTGRKDAAEVRKGLARLELSRSEKGCVDLCLATNMISVGLDVPRLGTMVICSQPKQTSEYIQASSRIGRGSDSKGMVFVLYGSTRPRDRSHYENFKNYHESFYRYVEPSSVTAFCKQVRKRALAGVLVGLYRAINPSIETPNDPDKSKLKIICDRIIDRIQRVDPDEVVGAQADLADIVERWMCQDYARWESLNPLPRTVDSEKAVPLLHPTGVTPCAEWAMSSFEAPLSLRTVDDECRVAVIGRYPSDEEGSE